MGHAPLPWCCLCLCPSLCHPDGFWVGFGPLWLSQPQPSLLSPPAMGHPIQLGDSSHITLNCGDMGDGQPFAAMDDDDLSSLSGDSVL